jgi:hypothetical protein
MASWRQQVLLEAPVEKVWDLVGDPNRYPEWAGFVIDVTGLPRVEKGATYTQKTRSVVGTATTTFLVEELVDLHEVKLRCTSTGYYCQWVLTAAQGETFAEVEIGMDPSGPMPRAVDAMVGKRWYRRLTDRALDGLRARLRNLALAPP